MHRFRFGVQLRNAADGPSWRHLARKAEQLGFSSLFVPDHFADLWAPIVAMTAAVEATKTLRVGALVFDNDFRHPAVLAKEMATLDVLSSGRVEVGMGAGWLTADYEHSGITLDPAAVRIERMIEALEILRLLFRGEAATFHGTHYRIDGLQGLPKPHTSGGPPIIVGGGGRKVLAAAARYASIVGVNPDLRSGSAGAEAARTAVSARYRERIEWIRTEAGERFDEIELQVLGQIEMVVPNRDDLYRQVAPSFGVTPSEAAEMPIVMVGTVEQICDDLVRRREQLGFSYIVVHDMDAFAPVVARLAGT